MSNINDFQIENGILKKYTGSEKYVEIPGNVTSIGDSAFRWCTDVESIVIPASVTSIGYYVLSNCVSLTNLTVDEKNPKYYSKGNCIIDSGSRSLVLGCQSSIIPDDGSVTQIASFAFSGCVALDSIKIPCTVKRIWDYAFDGCYNLENIVLPSSVEYIGCHTFEGCESFESIVIPESVTYIGDCAFFDCRNLKSFAATDSLTGFGVNIFGGCSDELLITATIGSPVEEYAIKNGIKVKSVL